METRAWGRGPCAGGDSRAVSERLPIHASRTARGRSRTRTAPGPARPPCRKRSVAKSGRIDDRRLTQREAKRRPALDLALRPNLSAMPPHDPSHRREPDPGPFELVRRMQPLKRLEQLADEAHVEPAAV